MEDRYGLYALFSFQTASGTKANLKTVQGQLTKLRETVNDLSKETGASQSSFAKQIGSIGSAGKQSLPKATKLAQQGVKSLKAEFKALRAESRLIDFGDLTDADAFKKADKELKQYINDLKRLEQQVDRNTTEGREFAATLKSQQAATGAKRTIAKAQRDALDASEKLGVATSAKAAGEAILSPLKGFAEGAIEIYADFDDKMAAVSAITTASGKKLDAMREKAKKLGATTRFTASDAAEAMTYLGMAGFKTDAILAGVGATLNLASAGQLGLAEAADISSNVLSGFMMQVEELDHITDVMAKTANSANTNIQQMGVAMSYAAPNAKLYGATLEETSAIIGVMSNAGIQADKAGTAARGAFLKLASPTAAGAAALQELGIRLDDGAGGMRNIIELMDDLSKKTGINLTAEQIERLAAAGDNLEEMEEIVPGAAKQIKYLKDIFGTTGISGAAAAMGQMDEMKRLAIANLGSSVDTESLSYVLKTQANIKIGVNEDGTEEDPFAAVLKQYEGDYAKAKEVIQQSSDLIRQATLNQGFDDLKKNNNQAFERLKKSLGVTGDDIYKALLEDKEMSSADAFIQIQREANKLGIELKKPTGAAMKMALVMEDNLAGSFRSLDSAWAAVKLNLFEPIAPMFRMIIDLLTKLALFVANLPKPFRALIGVGATLAVMAAGLLVVGGAVGIMLMGWQQAAASAAVSMAALGRSGVPLTGFYATSLQAAAATNPLNTALRLLGTTAKGVGTAFLGALGPLAIVAGVLGAIYLTLKTLYPEMDILGTAGAIAGMLLESAAIRIQAAWQGFVNWFGNMPLVQYALIIAQGLINALNHNPTVRIPLAWVKATDWIKDLFWELVIEAQIVGMALNEAFLKIRAFAVTSFWRIRHTAQSAFSEIAKFADYWGWEIYTNFQIAGTEIEKVFLGVRAFAVTSFWKIRHTSQAVGTTLSNIFQNTGTGIANTFTDVKDTVVSTFWMLVDITEAIAPIIGETLFSGINSAWQKVTGLFTKKKEEVAETVQETIIPEAAPVAAQNLGLSAPGLAMISPSSPSMEELMHIRLQQVVDNWEKEDALKAEAVTQSAAIGAIKGAGIPSTPPVEVPSVPIMGAVDPSIPPAETSPADPLANEPRQRYMGFQQPENQGRAIGDIIGDRVGGLFRGITQGYKFFENLGAMGYQPKKKEEVAPEVKTAESAATGAIEGVVETQAQASLTIQERFMSVLSYIQKTFTSAEGAAQAFNDAIQAYEKFFKPLRDALGENLDTVKLIALIIATLPLGLVSPGFALSMIPGIGRLVAFIGTILGGRPIGQVLTVLADGLPGFGVQAGSVIATALTSGWTGALLLLPALVATAFALGLDKFLWELPGKLNESAKNTSLSVAEYFKLDKKPIEDFFAGIKSGMDGIGGIPDKIKSGIPEFIYNVKDANKPDKDREAIEFSLKEAESSGDMGKVAEYQGMLKNLDAQRVKDKEAKIQAYKDLQTDLGSGIGDLDVLVKGVYNTLNRPLFEVLQMIPVVGVAITGLDEAFNGFFSTILSFSPVAFIQFKMVLDAFYGLMKIDAVSKTVALFTNVIGGTLSFLVTTVGTILGAIGSAIWKGITDSFKAFVPEATKTAKDIGVATKEVAIETADEVVKVTGTAYNKAEAQLIKFIRATLPEEVAENIIFWGREIKYGIIQTTEEIILPALRFLFNVMRWTIVDLGGGVLKAIWGLLQTFTPQILAGSWAFFRGLISSFVWGTQKVAQFIVLLFNLFRTYKETMGFLQYGVKFLTPLDIMFAWDNRVQLATKKKILLAMGYSMEMANRMMKDALPKLSFAMRLRIWTVPVLSMIGGLITLNAVLYPIIKGFVSFAVTSAHLNGALKATGGVLVGLGQIIQWFAFESIEALFQQVASVGKWFDIHVVKALWSASDQIGRYSSKLRGLGLLLWGITVPLRAFVDSLWVVSKAVQFVGWAIEGTLYTALTRLPSVIHSVGNALVGLSKYYERLRKYTQGWGQQMFSIATTVIGASMMISGFMFGSSGMLLLGFLGALIGLFAQFTVVGQFFAAVLKTIATVLNTVGTGFGQLFGGMGGILEAIGENMKSFIAIIITLILNLFILGRGNPFKGFESIKIIFAPITALITKLMELYDAFMMVKNIRFSEKDKDGNPILDTKTAARLKKTQLSAAKGNFGSKALLKASGSQGLEEWQIESTQKQMPRMDELIKFQEALEKEAIASLKAKKVEKDYTGGPFGIGARYSQDQIEKSKNSIWRSDEALRGVVGRNGLFKDLDISQSESLKAIRLLRNEEGQQGFIEGGELSLKDMVIKAENVKITTKVSRETSRLAEIKIGGMDLKTLMSQDLSGGKRQIGGSLNSIQYIKKTGKGDLIQNIGGSEYIPNAKLIEFLRKQQTSSNTADQRESFFSRLYFGEKDEIKKSRIKEYEDSKDKQSVILSQSNLSSYRDVMLKGFGITGMDRANPAARELAIEKMIDAYKEINPLSKRKFELSLDDGKTAEIDSLKDFQGLSDRDLLSFINKNYGKTAALKALKDRAVIGLTEAEIEEVLPGVTSDYLKKLRINPAAEVNQTTEMRRDEARAKMLPGIISDKLRPYATLPSEGMNQGQKSDINDWILAMGGSVVSDPGKARKFQNAKKYLQMSTDQLLDTDRDILMGVARTLALNVEENESILSIVSKLESSAIQALQAMEIMETKASQAGNSYLHNLKLEQFTPVLERKEYSQKTIQKMGIDTIGNPMARDAVNLIANLLEMEQTKSQRAEFNKTRLSMIVAPDGREYSSTADYTSSRMERAMVGKNNLLPNEKEDLQAQNIVLGRLQAVLEQEKFDNKKALEALRSYLDAGDADPINMALEKLKYDPSKGTKEDFILKFLKENIVKHGGTDNFTDLEMALGGLRNPQDNINNKIEHLESELGKLQQKRLDANERLKKAGKAEQAPSRNEVELTRSIDIANIINSLAPDEKGKLNALEFEERFNQLDWTKNFSDKESRMKALNEHIKALTGQDMGIKGFEDVVKIFESNNGAFANYQNTLEENLSDGIKKLAIQVAKAQNPGDSISDKDSLVYESMKEIEASLRGDGGKSLDSQTILGIIRAAKVDIVEFLQPVKELSGSDMKKAVGLRRKELFNRINALGYESNQEFIEKVQRGISRNSDGSQKTTIDQLKQAFRLIGEGRMEEVEKMKHGAEIMRSFAATLSLTGRKGADAQLELEAQLSAHTLLYNASRRSANIFIQLADAMQEMEKSRLFTKKFRKGMQGLEQEAHAERMYNLKAESTRETRFKALLFKQSDYKETDLRNVGKGTANYQKMQETIAKLIKGERVADKTLHELATLLQADTTLGATGDRLLKALRNLEKADMDKELIDRMLLFQLQQAAKSVPKEKGPIGKLMGPILDKGKEKYLEQKLRLEAFMEKFQKENAYSLQTLVEQSGYESVDKVIKALKEEGFGPAEIKRILSNNEDGKAKIKRDKRWAESRIFDALKEIETSQGTQIVSDKGVNKILSRSSDKALEKILAKSTLAKDGKIGNTEIAQLVKMARSGPNAGNFRDYLDEASLSKVADILGVDKANLDEFIGKYRPEAMGLFQFILKQIGTKITEITGISRETIGDAIQKAADSAWSGTKRATGNTLEGLRNQFVKALIPPKLLRGVANIVEGVGFSVASFVSNLRGVPIVNRFSGTIEAMIAGTTENMTKTLRGNADKIAALPTFTQGIQKLVTSINGFFQSVSQSFQKAGQSVNNGISNLKNLTLVQWIGKTLKSVREFFGLLTNSQGGSKKEKIANWAKQKSRKLGKSVAYDLATAPKDQFTKLNYVKNTLPDGTIERKLVEQTEEVYKPGTQISVGVKKLVAKQLKNLSKALGGGTKKTPKPPVPKGLPPAAPPQLPPSTPPALPPGASTTSTPTPTVTPRTAGALPPAPGQLATRPSTSGSPMGEKFYQTIDVEATRVESRWERAVKKVKTTMSRLAQVAKVVGKLIVRRLSENSPGPTHQIRENYEHTAQAVEGNMHEMAATAQVAGGQIEQAMTKSATNSQKHIFGLGNAFSSLTKAGMAVGGVMTATGMAAQTLSFSLSRMGIIDESASDALYKFTELFTIIGTITGLATPLFGAITAIFGALISTGGFLIGTLGSIGGLLVGLLNPVSLTIAAVVGGILLINALTKKFFGKDFLSPLFQGVAQFFPAMISSLTTSSVKAFTWLTSWLTKYLPALAPIFQGAMSFLGFIFEPLQPAVNWLTEKMEGVKSIFDDAVSHITGAWQGFTNKFWPILSPIVKGALDAAQGLINALNHNPTERIPEAWEGAVQRISDSLSWLIEPALAIAQGLINALNHNPTEKIPNAWEGAVGQIQEFLKGLPIVGALVSEDLIGLFDPAKIFGGLTEKLGGLLNIGGIGKMFPGLGEWFKSFGKKKEVATEVVVPPEPLIKLKDEMKMALTEAIKDKDTAAISNLQMLQGTSNGYLLQSEYEDVINPESNFEGGQYLKQAVDYTKALAKARQREGDLQTIAKGVIGQSSGDEVKSAIKDLVTDGGTKDLLFSNTFMERRNKVAELQKTIAQLEAKQSGTGGVKKKKLSPQESAYLAKTKDQLEQLKGSFTDSQKQFFESIGIDPFAAETAVDTVTGALTDIQNEWDDRMAFYERGGSLEEAIAPGLEQMTNGFQILGGDVANFAVRGWNALKKWDMTELGNAAHDFGGNVMAATGMIVDGFASARMSVLAFGVASVLSLSPLTLTLLGAAFAVFALSTNFLGLRTIAGGLFQVAKGVFTGIVALVRMLVNSLKAIGMIFNAIRLGDLQMLKAGFQFLVTSVKTGVSQIAAAFKQIFGGALQVLKGTFEGIAQIGRNIFKLIGIDVMGLWRAMSNLGLIAAGVREGFVMIFTRPKAAWEKFKTLIQDIINKVKELMGAVANSAEKAGEKVKSSPLGQLARAVKKRVTGEETSFENARKAVDFEERLKGNEPGARPEDQIVEAKIKTKGFFGRIFGGDFEKAKEDDEKKRKELVADAVDEGRSAIAALANTLGSFAPHLAAPLFAISTLADGIFAIGGALPAIKAGFAAIIPALTGITAGAAGATGATALWGSITATASAAATAGFTAVTVAARSAWAAITGPILPVIIIIGLLAVAVGGLFLAFKNNFLGVQKLFTGLFNGIKDFFSLLFSGGWDILAGIFITIEEVVGEIFGAIKEIGATLIEPFKPLFEAFGLEGGGGIGPVIQGIVKLLLFPLRVVAEVLKFVIRAIGFVIVGAVKLGGVFTSALMLPIKGAWKIMETIVSIVKMLWGAISAVGGAVLNYLLNPFNLVWRVVQGITGFLQKIPFVGTWLGGGTTQTTDIPRYATGGLVTGPGGGTDDRIPALISNGEYVVNAAATRNNLGFLEAINSGVPVEEALELLPVAPPPLPVPVSSAPVVAQSSGGEGETKIEVNLNIGEIHLHGGATQDNAKEFLESIGPKLEQMVVQAMRQRMEFMR